MHAIGGNRHPGAETAPVAGLNRHSLGVLFGLGDLEAGDQARPGSHGPALRFFHLPAHPGYYGEMVWISMMLEQWLRQHAPGFRVG